MLIVATHNRTRKQKIDIFICTTVMIEGNRVQICFLID